MHQSEAVQIGRPEDDDAIAAARERRLDLKTAMSTLETVAAKPATGDDWRSGLRAALLDVHDALEAHVDEVEGADGLLEEMVQDAPRLVNRIRALSAEHHTLRSQVADVTNQLDTAEDPGTVRAAIGELLMGLVRHRQVGADLVYEAYSVDIGGG